MTQTYFSPFFPSPTGGGKKGSTIPVVTTTVIEQVTSDVATAVAISEAALSGATASAAAAEEAMESALASANTAIAEAADAALAAADAANALASAETARVAAEAASTNAAADEALAEAHKNAAATSATNAAGSATIATGQATIATDAASAAATSQSVSAGHASTATTQASIATSQAAAASASASTATTQADLSATHASTASTQAGVATTQAGTATAAGATATTQANLSATYAGQANAYSQTVALTPNAHFIENGLLWGDNYGVFNGGGASPGTWNSSWVGKTGVLLGAADAQLSAAGMCFAVDPSRKYKVRSSAWTSGSNYVYTGLSFFDAGRVWIGQRYGGNYYPGTPNTWIEYTSSFDGIGAGDTQIPSNAAYAMPFCWVNYSGGVGTRGAIDYCYVEDVTESLAAASSATIASTQAASATSAASTATTQANLSSTFATNASNSATAAGTSATNAAGSATTATNQAGIATTQATTASAAASTATTQATLSSSFAAGAGRAAITTLPSNFVQDGAFFSDYTSNILSVPRPALSGLHTFPTVSGIGKVCQFAGGTTNYSYLSTNGFIKIAAGRVYRARTKVRVTAGDSEILYLGFAGYDASGAFIEQISNDVNPAVTSGGSWVEQIYERTTAQILAANSNIVYIASYTLLNHPYRSNAANVTQVEYLALEDVTSENTATTQAGIASTQATSATAAASTAATQASLSATYAGNAASSANTATTQAATATAAASTATTQATLSASHASNAAGSATTATTQAGIATTQAATATAAASAASTSASLSATYAGQANTSATNASGSESNALGHANVASGAATTATTQAGIATAQAVTATAAVAAAQSSAVLSASIGMGSHNKNPTFADWTGGSGTLPANWNSWVLGTTNTREAGDLGGYAFQQACVAGTEYGISCNPAGMYGKKAAGYYVIEADVTLVSGSLESSAVYLDCTSFSDYIAFSTAKDSSNAVVGAGTAGRRYKFRKLVNYTGSNTDWTLHALSSWAGYGSRPAKTIRWHSCSVRDATPAEIRDQTVLAPMEATVATHATAITTQAAQIATLTSTVSTQGAAVSSQATAITDLQVKISVARLRQTAAASGGTPAMFELYSDNAGNSFAWLSAAQIRWGTNTLFDDATDTVITTTGGNKYVQAMGAPFGVSNKMVQWMGSSSVALGSMSRANAYFYIAVDAPFVGGSQLPTAFQITKEGAVTATLDFIVKAGQSRTAEAFYATGAGSGTSSATAQLQARLVGGSYSNIGSSGSDSGGPGDSLGIGPITGVITNSSGVDKRYEVSVAVTTTGSPGAINHADSYLKV